MTVEKLEFDELVVACYYETIIFQIKMPVFFTKGLPSGFLSLKGDACFEEVGRIIISPITIPSNHLAKS